MKHIPWVRRVRLRVRSIITECVQAPFGLTGDAKAGAHLCQKIGMAILRVNVASFLASRPVDDVFIYNLLVVFRVT